MTRLLLIPYDQTFLIFETNHSPENLAAAINSNHWNPPGEVLDWLSHHRSCVSPLRLCASVHGSLVVVTTRKVRTSHSEAAKDSATFALPRRQLQVLQGLMDGQTTKEIAVQLAIQPRTVFMHITALKQTFGARSRAEVVSLAAGMGILRFPKRKLRE